MTSQGQTRSITNRGGFLMRGNRREPARDDDDGNEAIMGIGYHGSPDVRRNNTQ